MNTILKTTLAGAIGIAGLVGVSAAQAAASVSWTTPPDGTTDTVGTAYTPTGNASASGRVTPNTDLVLVLDSSGSMSNRYNANGGSGWACWFTSCQSLREWQQDFATALVDSLPMDGSTRVGVVEFDSDANVVRTLSDLSTDKNAVIAAINSVDAGGSTNIMAGQNAATTMLSNAGSLADPNTFSGYVVFSDGDQSWGYPGTPDGTSDANSAAGVDLIASIALPGANTNMMKSIVNGADDIFGTADDTGAFINGTTNLQAITDALTGNGSLVGIDHVDVTMPDGTVYSNVAVGATGNFVAPAPYNIALGPNMWTADAVATDGTTASANVTVIGDAPDPIPAPGVVLLLGAGLIGAGAARRFADKR